MQLVDDINALPSSTLTGRLAGNKRRLRFRMRKSTRPKYFQVLRAREPTIAPPDPSQGAAGAAAGRSRGCSRTRRTSEGLLRRRRRHSTTPAPAPAGATTKNPFFAQNQFGCLEPARRFSAESDFLALGGHSALEVGRFGDLRRCRAGGEVTEQEGKRTKKVKGGKK